MSQGCLTAAQLTVPGRLQGVDLQVRPGELLGLLGPNGAGKSTLLSELSGTATRQVAPRRSAATQVVHGTVSWRGRPLSEVAARERARAIGYLPQHVVSAWDLSVRDVVALGRLAWGDEGLAESVDQAMHQTDVWALRARSVRTLSGGEWARVCLARVLAGEPQVMLVDEPTSHLDLSHQLQVMALLQAQAQSGRAVVVAVHDLGLAARYCHRLVLLRHGCVVAQGTVGEVLRPDLLHEVYGVAVHVDLQAVPPVVLPC
jgi:ABC-type cobalamin/Fe3+-siderophores transport system ATPase subunit